MRNSFPNRNRIATPHTKSSHHRLLPTVCLTAVLLTGMAATQAQADLTTSLGYSIYNAHYTQSDISSPPPSIPGSTQVTSGNYNIVVLTSAANATILTGETASQAGFPSSYTGIETGIVTGSLNVPYKSFRTDVYNNYSITPPITVTAVAFASTGDGVDLGTVDLPASTYSGAVGAYGLEGAFTAPADTPEPGTMALFASSALIGGAFLRRRKQVRHSA